jgi:hypothetical protein
MCSLSRNKGLSDKCRLECSKRPHRVTVANRYLENATAILMNKCFYGISTELQQSQLRYCLRTLAQLKKLEEYPVELKWKKKKKGSLQEQDAYCLCLTNVLERKGLLSGKILLRHSAAVPRTCERKDWYVCT